MYDLCVVGCGAAGMSAAITAARQGLKVIIIEKNKKPGKKMYATGNGRCNLTNMDFNFLRDYRSSHTLYEDFLKHILGERPEQRIVEFLDSIGILTYEQDGYLYPNSLQASSVVWSMVDALKFLNVKMEFKAQIASITRENSCFEIKWQNGQIRASQVVLACGSMAYPSLGGCEDGYHLAKKMGHSIEDVRPALCGLITMEDVSVISGVRTPASAKLLDSSGNVLAGETGELQVTDYGVSGIMIFNLSSLAGAMLKRGETPKISFDFLGDMEEKLQEALSRFSNRTVIGVLNGFLNDKIATYFTELCGIKRETLSKELDSTMRDLLVQTLKGYIVTIKGMKDFDSGQVCAGGVELEDIIPQTMESKIVENLFIAGELLDIDGRCGGYNLTFAILSGINAGKGAYAKNQSN